MKTVRGMQRATLRAIVAIGVGSIAAGFPAIAHSQSCPLVKTRDKAKSVKVVLQRAQPACTTPTITAFGGIPACTGNAPAPSAEFAVSPFSTRSKLLLKSTPTGDVDVQFAVSGLLEADLVTPADGAATLEITARLIGVDLVNGGATTIPIFIPAALTVSGGKAAVKTSINQMLAGIGFGPLPNCFKIEIEQISMLDGASGPVLDVGTSPLFSEKSGVSYGSKG